MIRGQVIARDSGKPVAGAVVSANTRGDHATTTADADGRFEIELRHDGFVMLDAHARGYASGAVRIDTELDEIRVLVDPAFNIKGRIVDKRDPVRGVSGVTVSGVGEMLSRQTCSGVDGTFELFGVRGDGVVVVVATKEGWIWANRQLSVVGDVSDLTIELVAGATLSGRVDPPAVAQIAATRVGASYFFDTPPEIPVTTTSDATGAFTLSGVAAGQFEVRAMTKNGYRGALTISVGDGDQSGLVVALSPRLVIRGRVIDTNRQPVAGRYLQAYLADAPLELRHNVDGIIRSVESAADGSFELVGLDPGTYELDDQIIELAEHGCNDITVVVPARNGTIRGRVIGADGRPTISARVDMFHSDVRTDENGEFVIEKRVPGTQETLYAEAANGKSYGVSRDVAVGDVATIYLVAQGSLTISVSGTADVRCFGPPGIGFEAKSIAEHTFEQVPSVEYRCEAIGADGAATANVTVNGGPTRLELVLEPWATLTGVAVDVMTGAPIAGIVVAAAPGASGESDADCRFVVERVRPGNGDMLFMTKDQLTYGVETHPFTALPGERVDVGTIAIVAPRTVEPGTYRFTTAVRDGRLVVTSTRAPELLVGDTITTIDARDVTELGLLRAKRILTSGIVGVRQTVTLGLARGATVIVTAVHWV